MDDVSWTDLGPLEQRAIAVLGAGMSAKLCAPVALQILSRMDLVRGPELTLTAEQLRRAVILHKLAAQAGLTISYAGSL